MGGPCFILVPSVDKDRPDTLRDLDIDIDIDKDKNEGSFLPGPPCTDNFQIKEFFYDGIVFYSCEQVHYCVICSNMGYLTK